jgi:hypothetical protein
MITENIPGGGQEGAQGILVWALYLGNVGVIGHQSPLFRLDLNTRGHTVLQSIDENGKIPEMLYCYQSHTFDIIEKQARITRITPSSVEKESGQQNVGF